MPTRPSQTDPARARRWDEYRGQVGSRIRQLRIEQGLTQEALALESGVTRNVLIHVEHGRRGLLYERLFDIAEVLGVPAGSLLCESDQDLT
ncbi:helix-turn-helix domain-containing protein [Rhodococcus sp. ARC_M12]|uniref:helix-turn-helix domain-containing protein n=1 Tax=Rhodococcus sp. ARC_M12 TaxID=2928854 RepID=UPI001FB45B08|nr:helix-turn-helix transcriptional regulator [Rhodococcus sp. ARC_M12]MCJ0980474.1 helix-turn-helix domain-containing protein [Rhodococcus sp. ARC_M12]